jgi:sulfate transport system substrate-binding protein
VKGEVFDKAVIPAFKEYYRNETGRDIKFKTLYAGSGDITNQVVVGGAAAEVMVLSTEWDALTVKKAGLCTTDWNSFPYNGTISTSPWVIMVRPGNPKGIEDFRDLAKDGIELVHPDPVTSGGACWSLFAVYGSELRRTAAVEGAPNTDSAKTLLDGVIDNVERWPSSARNALAEFTEAGFGDALITYENDALLAKAKGKDFDLVYPNSTILSEHKAILVDRNIAGGEREACQMFIDFLSTEKVQQFMVDYNFRSPNEDLNGEFIPITDPFFAGYLGGWEKAHEEIIDGYFVEFKEG